MDEKIIIPSETSDMLSRYANNKHHVAFENAMQQYRKLIGGDDIPAVGEALDAINRLPEPDFTELPDLDKNAVLMFEKIEHASSYAEAMDIHAQILFSMMDSKDPSVKEGLQAIFELFQMAIDAGSTKSIRDIMTEDTAAILDPLVTAIDALLEILPSDSEIDLREIFPGLNL